MKNFLFLSSYGTLTFIVASTLIFYTFAIPIQKVEAGGGGLATEPTQLLVRAEATISAVQNTITASASTLTAGATTALFTKENLLDGIGWAIAKQMVNQITRRLIDWINSGFEGSPAFILDLKSHLLTALDTVAGEYIESLGGIGEIICSPFRLDVQAALTVNYNQAQTGMPSGPTACTLSGIGSNIEGFLAGEMSGGWDQWFQVTANPQNTPIGAYLEAEAKLNAALVNEAGKEIELANWGAGFLSQKVCETPEGGTAQSCTITTPGRVISEALTFQLSTGPRSLIEADEINEIIGALMNQLVITALEGVNGLLGLGGNENYTNNNYGGGEGSYIDQLELELPINEETAGASLSSQSAVEQEYLTVIDQTIATTIRIMGGVPSSPAALLTETQRDAYDLYVRAVAERAQVESNLGTVTSLNADFNAGNTEDAVVQYSQLYQAGIFTNPSDAAAMQAELEGIIREE